MKKNFLFVLSLFVILGFASCSSDDNDTEKPVISNVEPADGDILVIGEKVHLEMDLSDNEELASYKIDIHNNFDNHEHSKASSSDSIAFSFVKTWTDIHGQKNAHVHHHQIEIPKEMMASDGKLRPVREGKYHFVIYCLDEVGNESVLSRNVILSYTEPGGEHDDDLGHSH
ncbi:DUF4625 domain-containing protein [Dysgonomonas sp. ZJ709]|uniref:DUF4625 domain-containing protein n=1 Tax=Dysgonomonas sp. ZJ709 TaxID=2709797 RepID=UPI0013EA3D39|nr:DUF4625 domain-containing protein [Dysgonomonas sp. ZJ709]